MTDFDKQLAEPFDPALVSWRIGPTTKDKTKGMALAYIDARDVMRRLDQVCGPSNWQNDYPWSDGKRVVCRIGIRTGDEWIWKTDGAGDTDTEGEKGALSDAFKRAAVHWGIGRYLYDVDAVWVAIEAKGNSYVIAEGEYGKLRARLPRPAQSAPGAASARPASPAPSQPVNGKAAPATTGDAPIPHPVETERRDEVALATARQYRNEITVAIEKARTPADVDKAVAGSTIGLQFIKSISMPTYDRIMSLAAAKSNELRAGA
jgi:hypothetical protein